MVSPEGAYLASLINQHVREVAWVDDKRLLTQQPCAVEQGPRVEWQKHADCTAATAGLVLGAKRPMRQAKLPLEAVCTAKPAALVRLHIS